MIGGFVVSLVVFAVGAILDFAVTISPYQHGLNINKVGLILMIVGGVGAVVSLVALLASGPRRRTVVEEDAAGNRVRRQDTYA